MALPFRDRVTETKLLSQLEQMANTSDFFARVENSSLGQGIKTFGGLRKDGGVAQRGALSAAIDFIRHLMTAIPEKQRFWFQLNGSGKDDDCSYQSALDAIRWGERHGVAVATLCLDRQQLSGTMEVFACIGIPSMSKAISFRLEAFNFDDVFPEVLSTTISSLELGAQA